MSPHRHRQEQKILEVLRRRKMGITRLETAKLLKLPKSGHIAKILDDMVKSKLVVVKRGVDGHRRNIFIYFQNDLKEG